MIRAILFDMDGTLVDSEPFYYNRKREYLKLRNLPNGDTLLNKFIGRDMRDFFAFIFENDSDRIQTYFKDYQSYIIGRPADYTTMIFPEVLEILSTCKNLGYKLALVSSSPWGNINTMLAQCQLESFFTVVISGSDMPKSKPDPQVYTEAMKQLSLSPSQCIVVEDSLSGIIAGKKAGCTVIKRGYAHQKQADNHVSYYINNLKELLSLLSSI